MKVAARDLERMARPTGVGRALATYEQLRRDGGGPELDGP